jgi:hypothetical protein
LWSPAVAIGGNRSQAQHRSEPQERAKPLPSVATTRRSQRMVRRGSAVRVRQRALQKRRKSELFLWHWFARAPVCSGYGAVYGAFRFRTPLSLVADAVSIGRIGSASAVWDAACKGRSGENEYTVEAGEVPAVKPRRLKWQEVVGRLGGPEEPPRAFCATGEAAARRGSPPVLPSRSVRLSGGAEVRARLDAGWSCTANPSS